MFGESFAGVLAGGRTGLTAFGMALLFLLTLPLHPLLEAVPLCASAPVLVVLGSQLLALIPGACARKHLDFDDMSHGFPSFVTIVGMPFFAGIEKGIAAGLASWAALQVVDLGWRAALHCLAALEACVATLTASGGRRRSSAGKRLQGGGLAAANEAPPPSYQAVENGQAGAKGSEGGDAFAPLVRTNTLDRLSEGMPPRQSSFTKSPAPGVFKTPYEVSRAARPTVTDRAGGAGAGGGSGGDE